MARGQEETSPSQVGRKRGPNRELPSTSTLVSSMSMEELMSYYQILENISLALSNGLTISTVGEANNAVHFTREQFTTGLCLPVTSLVKRFLHVSRAPPTLIHPNFIRILMGCRVLNLLYRLDISLVEIFFVYKLKLGTGGKLSMSAHNPRLQIVTELPNSPKTEAKGVVLVRGPWYETPGSLELPFDMNQSLVSQVCFI